MQHNEDIAAIFDEIADLLEITGEQAFRINSYRKAARTLRDLSADIADLAASGEHTKLPGIGKGMAAKIEEYLTQQGVDLHTELLESVPAGLPALLEIPNLGPKRIALAWRELGIEDLAGLKAAIADGRLATLKGFGPKLVATIAQGIRFAEQAAGRTPLGLAWPLARELAAAMRTLPNVGRVDVTGSVRRGCETIGDIDILCESDDGETVVSAFTTLTQAKRVLASGQTKGSIIVDRRDGVEMQADCRVVPAESYGAALQYFTGSKEHNVRLRELAVRHKWKLNEWGLYDSDTRLAGEREEDIYERLGLPWIPPEQREDRGEFEPDAVRPLVELRDIRGDLHLHTTESDGVVSAAEMAAAAERLGYEYIAITDHSKSSTIANGLSIDRMWRQIERIRHLNQQLKTLTVLVGCECDILADGSLDYPDQLLAACDFVVASVHTAMRQDTAKLTARLLRALDSPYLNVVGHPTGRLLGRREAMDFEMAAVIKKAAETRTALELNASWQRLDLGDRHLRAAREAGVMICISTDAHSTAQLEQMNYGVITARRGWLQAEQVLNTRPLPLVRKWLAEKRQRA